MICILTELLLPEGEYLSVEYHHQKDEQSEKDQKE
jgi:hypothetical protein